LSPKKSKSSSTLNTIYDRQKYGKELMKKLKLKVKSNKYCMKIYKYNEEDDRKTQFSINDEIILEKEIKSNDYTYITYLGYHKDYSEDKFYIIINSISNKKQDSEDSIISPESCIILSEKISELVVEDKWPHFPLIYCKLICNDFKEANKDLNSYELELFPYIIEKSKKNISLIKEIHDGNIINFIKENSENKALIENTLIQIFISLMFFNKTFNLFYFNMNLDENLIYRKIKPGGYFHYKILDKDYYIENLGYLWMIDDFNFVMKINKEVDIRRDYDIFLKYFIDEKIITKSISEIHKAYNKPKELAFTEKKFEDFINNILTLFYNYKIIKTKDEINKTDKIINKTPYTINSTLSKSKK